MPRPADVGVGTAVFLLRESPLGRTETLFGRRAGAHGAGEWSLPGGWIDRVDGTIEGAAAREVEEETGFVVQPECLRFVCALKNEYLEFSTVTLFYVARVSYEEVRTVVPREPAKCDGWVWCDLDDPPHPLFNAVDAAVEHLRGKKSRGARSASGGPRMRMRKTFYLTVESEQYERPSQMDDALCDEVKELLGAVADSYRVDGHEVSVSDGPTCPIFVVSEEL